MKLFVTITTILLATMVSAEPERGAISLDQAVHEALGRNPRLAALGDTRDAMLERPAQAAGLPNPMFTYRGMDSTGSGAFPNTGEKRFEIEQPLPGYGKRALREAVAAKEAGVMGTEVEAMAREVVWRVKETAYELQAVQKALLITRDEDAVLKRMNRVAEARYAAGETAQADVVKAQTEITMLGQKQLEWEGREKMLKAKLALLMNRDAGHFPETVVAPIPDGAAPDPAAQVKAAMEKRAELKSARLKVDRSELQRQLMTRESRPDYKVGLEYRAIENGDDMVMFMVGVDLPLWRGKTRAAVREAGLMAAASEADRVAVERQVALEVQSACYKVETAKRMLALYRKDLIPQAAVRLQSSEAGYRAGKVDFSDWMESQRFALTVRTMAAMTEGELGTGWAALEWAVGGAL